jgi:transcriptional regulator with XRE-family HTH domain
LSSFRPELYRRIIELLIEARKEAGMTQAELGKRLGQRQTVISKIEQGERRLDMAEFIAFCRAINVDARQLLHAIDEQECR